VGDGGEDFGEGRGGVVGGWGDVGCCYAEGGEGHGFWLKLIDMLSGVWWMALVLGVRTGFRLFYTAVFHQVWSSVLDSGTTLCTMALGVLPELLSYRHGL
jgi:hypothetical protein